ncbi:phosphotransferase family protein [Cellulomonas sp. ICMP 17802]|uniref:phosphotransferase family protein n=1 Tax=Cellulomonas sp. ICMP 17802 TaxID=3239199 RepID=UPI00351B0551
MTTGRPRPAGRTELARRGVRLLLERGLLSPADIHRYGLTARNVSQSNGVALVELGSGRGFAVKDLAPDREPGQGDPAREVELYRAATASGDLADRVPRLLLHDADEQVLVLEGVLAARRLDLQPEPTSGRFAAELGTTLGLWHRVSTGLAPMGPARPWVLDLAGPTRPAVIDRSAELSGLVSAILADEQHADALARMRAAWTDDVLVHGDVRFANVLVRPHGVATLVDWEYAGSGDARWDVAGAVQEYVSAGETLDGAPVTALLSAYEAARGLAVDRAVLTAFVAARLLVRALQLRSWMTDPGAEIERHRRLARQVVEPVPA